jgi:hypothetical protein
MTPPSRAFGLRLSFGLRFSAFGFLPKLQHSGRNTHHAVGQAFQPAGSRAFPAPGIRPGDWNVARTGRQECLPYTLGPRGANCWLCGAVCALVLRPDSLLACAACYGASDSPMAQGMNWGIFSLLAVIGVVLGGVAAFFIYLARRAAAVAAQAAEPLLPLMNTEHGLE